VIAASLLKQSLDEQFRKEFKDHESVSHAFSEAPVGGVVATSVVKLMRNLCVHNPRVQALWRASGTIDRVMATAGQGDAAYQRIIATFVSNVVAGDKENRDHMSGYFPWSFIRWATIDVDVAYMVLQNMGDVAESLLRGNPAFCYLFIALAAQSSRTKESEWVSIFFSTKSASFLEECITTIEGLDEPMLRSLQEAPEDFHDAIQDMCSKEDTLHFLWALIESVSKINDVGIGEDFAIRIMEQTINVLEDKNIGRTIVLEEEEEENDQRTMKKTSSCIGRERTENEQRINVLEDKNIVLEEEEENDQRTMKKTSSCSSATLRQEEASKSGEEETSRNNNNIESPACPVSGQAPSWWGAYTRIVIAHTADLCGEDTPDRGKEERWSGVKIMRFMLTRALPFLQMLLDRRATDPEEYVKLAQEWEVVSMLRIIGNVITFEGGKECVRENLWMLLNHTFCDPDLPMMQEVGLFAVQNACRECVPNQQRVYGLTQTSNKGIAHMPEFVRAALDKDGKLARVEE